MIMLGSTLAIWKCKRVDAYHSYIHQFKPSSTLLLPTVEQAPTVQVSHPDYAIFAEFVGRSGIPATTGQPMDHFEVDSRDEDLYKAYIKSGETSHYMGPSVQKADVPRYDVRKAIVLPRT